MPFGLKAKPGPLGPDSLLSVAIQHALQRGY